ncbi:MAG: hypothetical protein N2234_05305 [Planctomycetota bacterium]|nr:hypothetical protein [Planctomycetota bacterium]
MNIWAKNSNNGNKRKKDCLSTGEMFRLFWGKIRRFYYFTLGRSYLKRSFQQRRGECIRCGACCQLGHLCPLLRYDSSGLSYCADYQKRPPNCRIFPVDEHDLKDRNILSNKPCGFYFVRNKKEES